jgi:signal recognition particle subunit SRP54
MPFLGDFMPKGFKVEDKELVRIRSLIDSMTKAERRNPDIINDGRARRIARGAGHPHKAVKELMERFRMARVMMKEMGRATGMMGRIPGMRQAAGLSRLKRQGISMDPSMLSSMGGMAAEGAAGMPGMPGEEGARRKPQDSAKRKAARKKQRKARKKNRRK